MGGKKVFVRFLALLLAILLLASFTTSCTQKQEEGKKKETGKEEQQVYKIGCILSLSGAASPLGIPEKNAIQLLAEEINAAGKIKIELIIEDDQSDPAKATQAARKLIEQDKVIAIIGSSNTPCSLAIKEVVNQAKIPMMCPSAGNVITDVDNTWVFRTAPKDAVAVKTLLEYIKSEGSIKKVAILHDSNAFGQSGADQIKKDAPAYGLTVVAVEKYETNAPDLTAQMTKLKNANPDAIIVWGTNPGPAIAAKARVQLGIKVPMFGSHGIANKKFIELAGDAAEGVVFPAGKILVPDQLEENDPIKAVIEEFSKKYEAKYNEKAVTFTAHGYDALKILADALERAGTSEPEALRKAIEETKDYIGLDGTMSYSAEDHDGIGLDDMVVVKIEGGKWVRLK